MKKVYLVAVIAAIIVGISVYLFGASVISVSKTDKEADPVLIATVDIAQGTTITEEMIQVTEINRKAILPGSYVKQNAEVVVGMVATTNIYTGEQYTDKKITSPDNLSYNMLSYRLPEGYRAISFAVDNTTGVSNYIRGGDKSDIIYTVQTKNITPNGMHEATTEVFLENVDVLAVGTYIANNGETETEYATVTLSLPIADAMKLTTYVNTCAGGSATGGIGGKLSLLLRNKDDETTTTEIVKNVN